MSGSEAANLAGGEVTELVDFAEPDVSDASAAERADSALAAGADVRLQNNHKFASKLTDRRIHQTKTGEPVIPGTIRVDGARTPWVEMAENPNPERYPELPVAQQRLEAYFAGHGVDQHTIELVNVRDGRFARERDVNCGECARAVASLLNGQPEVARPLLPLRDTKTGKLQELEPFEHMSTALDVRGEFERTVHGDIRGGYDSVTRYEVDADVAAGYDRLQAELQAAGAGAHAVVNLAWKPPPGVGAEKAFSHWVNVANIDGHIVMIDGQNPRIDDMDSDFVHEQMTDVMQLSWIRAELQ